MPASDLSLIQKLGQLSAEHLAEVEDFVDFLRARDAAAQPVPQGASATPAAAPAPAPAQQTLLGQAGALLPTAGAAALGSVAGVAGALALGSLWDSVTDSVTDSITDGLDDLF